MLRFCSAVLPVDTVSTPSVADPEGGCVECIPTQRHTAIFAPEEYRQCSKTRDIIMWRKQSKATTANQVPFWKILYYAIFDKSLQPEAIFGLKTHKSVWRLGSARELAALTQTR